MEAVLPVGFSARFRRAVTVSVGGACPATVVRVKELAAGRAVARSAAGGVDAGGDHVTEGVDECRGHDCRPAGTLSPGLRPVPGLTNSFAWDMAAASAAASDGAGSEVSDWSRGSSGRRWAAM